MINRAIAAALRTSGWLQDWATILTCRHRQSHPFQLPDKRFALRCLDCGAVSSGTTA